MVISQYKNKNFADERSKNQNQQQPYRNQMDSSYSRNMGQGNESYGPKFERSLNRQGVNSQNPILDYSKGNYIDTVGLSQSNVVNDSNLINKFSMGGGNILNQFLKK